MTSKGGRRALLWPSSLRFISAKMPGSCRKDLMGFAAMVSGIAAKEG